MLVVKGHKDMFTSISEHLLKDVRIFAAIGDLSLLWSKVTIFLSYMGAISRSELVRVVCGRKLQGLIIQRYYYSWLP